MEKLKIVYEYSTGQAWADDSPPWMLCADCIEGVGAPTLAEYEAITEEQVEQMQGDLDVRRYGPKLGALVALLSAFGLFMPIERGDAVAAVNASVRADAALVPDALLLLSVLAELPLTDRRIYVAAGRLP